MSRAPRLLTSLALLALALTACGGDDEPTAAPGTPTSPAATAPPDGALVVSDGVSPEDLLGCLEAAGVEAEPKDSVPFGVEVPVEGIAVAVPEEDQEADLWVLADPAAAEEARPLITLADEDNATSAVAGNVVLRWFRPPAEGDTAPGLVTACLPAG